MSIFASASTCYSDLTLGIKLLRFYIPGGDGGFVFGFGDGSENKNNKLKPNSKKVFIFLHQQERVRWRALELHIL